jgi:hypothetical protein
MSKRRTTGRRKAGRPPGKVERKRIALPCGDSWVPLYTTFAEITGLHPKSLQRMRRQLPTAKIAGILYVMDAAGRAALGTPQKKRGDRR